VCREDEAREASGLGGAVFSSPARGRGGRGRGRLAGERASTEALETRVYVSLSRLRKMGFKGLLLSRDDDFLLDPSTPTYSGRS
jgi:hypothetical protein